MPDALKIEITKTPDIAAWLDRQRRPMLEAGKDALTTALARHFRKKNATPNARGFPRSQFWASAAESVTSAVEGDSIVVAVPKREDRGREFAPVSLRWKGGTIFPREGKKALAIPLDPAVAHIWPSEHGGVATGGDYDEGATSLFWPKNSSHGFIKDNETGEFLWLLVAKTTHKPDPSVMPSEDDLRKAIARRMRSAIRGLEAEGVEP